MKLFYSPGACSLAPHILLEELALPYEAVPVDLRANSYSGGDYRRVNPKGKVPALELDNGEVLTENAVVLLYLSNQKPDAERMPRFGTWDRYRALEWTHFIATELHKTFGPLFSPDTPKEYAEIVKKQLAEKFAYVSERLGDRHFLLGERFLVPDIYLFVMLTWAPKMGIDLSRWPNLGAFEKQMRALPAVKSALRAEGLETAAA